jgi:hypothetical protein
MTLTLKFKRLFRSTTMSLVAIVIIALAVIGANPFSDQTVGPFDLLVSKQGWGAKVQPSDVRHFEGTDVLDALLPHWIYARKEIRDGRIPLWNPQAGGGEPGIQK